MRILLLTQDYPASAGETIVSGAVKNPYYTVHALRAAGHAVSVVSIDRHRRGPAGDTVRRYRTWLKLLPRTLWLNLRSLPTLWRLAKHADLIQSHHPHFTAQIALLKALRLVRTPLIVKAHGTAFPELAANKYRGMRGALLRLNARVHLALDRLVLGRADKVLASSAFQLAEMRELYQVDEARLALIYNGAHPVAAAPPPVEASDVPVLLFVGRVVPKKGIDTFVALVRAVGKQRPVRGRLVLGQRNHVEDRAVLTSVVQPLTGDPAFDVLFDVPERDMPAIYQSAAALVAPSRGYESVPTVIYEAHAAGIPALATGQWGIPEVVAEDHLLTGDLTTDTARILAALDRPRQTTSRLPADFTWSAIATQYERLYRQMGLEA